MAGALGDAGRGTVEATWGPDLFVDEFAQLSKDIGRPVSWAAIMPALNQPGYSDDVSARVVAAGGEVYPQVACRPIVVQITLNDPFPFANVPAFAEILGLERADRAAPLPPARSGATGPTRGAGGVGRRSSSGAQVAETDVHPELCYGPTLAELAAGSGRSPMDVMVELAAEEGFETRFLVAMTNDDEDGVGRLLGNDQLLLGLSDAGAHTSQLCDANFATHLLGHWCRDKGVLSLEKAVWRLTGHPAMVYGLERPRSHRARRGRRRGGVRRRHGRHHACRAGSTTSRAGPIGSSPTRSASSTCGWPGRPSDRTARTSTTTVPAGCSEGEWDDGSGRDDRASRRSGAPDRRGMVGR